MTPRLPLPRPVLDGRIVAVLRAPTADYLLPVALALFDAGVHCIEVALTSPGALNAIEQIRLQLGTEAAIGAGTVIHPDDVRRASDAGATYLLSPTMNPEVLRAAQDLKLPFVPGAGTATEIATGWALGASAVKVFPAQSLGGPSFVKSILDPLPGISLLPTGGVQAADVQAYLAAGVVAVGVGSPLTGPALSGGSLDELRTRAAEFLAVAARNTQQ